MLVMVKHQPQICFPNELSFLLKEYGEHPVHIYNGNADKNTYKCFSVIWLGLIEKLASFLHL